MAGTEIKNVLVIGGGGNVGPAVLQALEAEGVFNVSILARQSSQSTFPLGVKVRKIDDSYPEAELLDAFRGQDAIICALSLQNIIQQIKFIDAAIEVGVKWFVPAEYGGNKEAATSGVELPSHGDKDVVLNHLKEAEAKGLSWTAVATGPFIDWGIANGFLGFDTKSQRAKIYASGDEVWTGTKVSTIGVAVARLLRKPEQVQNRFIYIYSVRTTQNEILATLEQLTATKWEVRHVDWDSEISEGQKKLEKGDRAGIVPLILSYFFRPGAGADYARDVEAANSLLDLPIESVVDVIREIIS